MGEKQEVTSLGRFDSSTASYCDRIQHFFSEDRDVSSQQFHTGPVTFILHAGDRRTDFYRVFRWLNFCYLLSNPSSSLLLINPAAQCLGHSSEITTRAVLSQIPSHIPEELNNHSYFPTQLQAVLEISTCPPLPVSTDPILLSNQKKAN